MLRSQSLPLRSTSLKTDDRDPPPDALGPFRVLHQIGLGTLGPVFRAYDPTRDRLVAVKLFRLDLTGLRLDQFVEALHHLIERHIPHPVIPTPLATGVAGRSAFLAQSFIAATSADAVLGQHGPMPLRNVLRAATQVAEALDSPVGREMQHGALHPRDWLLAADETRVTGFGVAKILEQLGVGAPVRSPYAAPERVHRAPWDHRADVFSLAAVVAEMMTGTPVTHDGVGSLDRLPNVSDAQRVALSRAIARALAVRPDDRFPTASAFVEALNQAVSAVDQEPVAALSFELTAPGGGTGMEGGVEDVLLHTDGGESDPSLEWDATLTTVSADPLLERMTDAVGLTRLVDAPGPDGSDPDGPGDAGDPDAPGDPGDRVNSAQPTLFLTSDDGTGGLKVPAAGPLASRAALLTPLSDAARSALWPLSLALVVGLVVGAAAGFITFITSGSAGAALTDGEQAVSAAPRSAPNGLAADLAPPPTPSERSRAGDSLSPTASSTIDRPAAVAHVVEPAPVRLETAEPSERPVGTTDGAAQSKMESAGRMLIRSLPAGARVLLDGKDVGSTPLPLRAIAFGAHTVRVMQDGYESTERHVVLTPTQPSESLIIDLAPTRARTAGSPVALPMVVPAVTSGGLGASSMAGLIVESRPSGATVFLNDRRLGTTPLTMDAVAPGSHAIRLELEGYRRWSSSVRVAVGERNRVAASLEH